MSGGLQPCLHRTQLHGLCSCCLCCSVFQGVYPTLRQLSDTNTTHSSVLPYTLPNCQTPPCASESLFLRDYRQMI
jgi:hypothetical protein